MRYVINERVVIERLIFQRVAAVASIFCLFVALPISIFITKDAKVNFIPRSSNTISSREFNKQSLNNIKKSSGSSHPIATSPTPVNNSIQLGSALQPVSCSLNSTVSSALANAQSSELNKLLQYEQLCNGPIISRDSFFITTPTSSSEAQSQASEDSMRLAEYAQYGIKPLVFMEPDTVNGTNIDLSLYASGSYDSSLQAYFLDLKKDGVTDSMMGLWVILPEGNLPVWTTVDPSIYEAVVVKTIQFQKAVFPASKTSLMLDSETYPVGASWGNGTYVSLLQYVKDIPKGLVDSFGLQGFPWAAPANQVANNAYDPKAYLRVDFAAEAASSLGINNIWLNTGTFNQMYTQNSSETVTASPLQRQTMLNGVIAQAKTLQAQGFSVDIHLFAQDKSNASEATDWSYWKTQPGNDANTAVFSTFAYDAKASGIPLWLFDTYDN